MQREKFTVRGATGIDLDLGIAGPGSRSYAFIIDWHIRLLVALAWLLCTALIVNHGYKWRIGSAKTIAASAFFVLLPSACIYFLYHPLLECLMRGQTPGKRVAGIRIVDRSGGVPGSGAILIRNVFRLVDSLPAFYLVGLVSTMISAQRIRIGDMAASTLLVDDERVATRSFDVRDVAGVPNPLGLHTLDLASELLERWPSLEAAKRESIARRLLLSITGLPADRIDRMTGVDLKQSVAQLVERGALE